MDRGKEPTSDVFTRRTRRGGVVSVLRERYFRTDVVPAVAALLGGGDGEGSGMVVAFDAAVAAVYTEVLEHGVASDLVLLQTVLDAVRETASSSRVCSRLRALAAPAAPKPFRCVFLANEHSAAMYVRREHGESREHRDARAVLAACQWLHVVHFRRAVRVVLLCATECARE
jgi:hypothetical protein